ncbi:hypothetical protein JFV29_03225 [Peribacillus sp. TH16]|uniref:LuxR C-terminal-related transcriptional regulator n=1 Tax=Peribacillus sp. TH16 TaxID=2798482 RepID=UPI001911CE42|nr:LuxR C-terminal-related transcriptional regulator [Peribacillus sp. TH16]MBK5480951.1 hypothetical protein [Peribacillus sp. TH16]
MEKLSRKDYEDIHRVLHETMVSPDMYRRQVLQALSLTFGYDKSIFWISESNGHLVDPTNHNIHDHIIDLYCSQYYQMDILYPMNIKEKMRCKQVIAINDVMSTFKYEKSLYYQSFMKEYGFYDELGVYLVHQAKLLGAIGLVRYEHEEPFNAKDTFKLEILAKSISFSLANFLLLEEIGAQKKTLEMLSNASSTGQILFNSAMTIYHANSAAKEICSIHFASQVIRNPVQQFLQEVIWKENWKLGLISKILLPTRQEVTIYIMKADISKDHYAAYLSLSDEKEVHHLIEEKLTTKERDILAYITKGYTNEEVSKELFISVNTVKRHLQNIYRKLGVKNRTSLSYLVMMRD